MTCIQSPIGGRMRARSRRASHVGAVVSERADIVRDAPHASFPRPRPRRRRARAMRASEDDARARPIVPTVSERVITAATGALETSRRGFSFTKREFKRRFKRMTVGSASKTTKRSKKRWRAVHRGNRIGRAERDAVTNHLGLCLQVAFTAQSESREAYERSFRDGEVVGREGDGAVKREVYAVRNLTLDNGDALPPFAYVVEAPREFARSRQLWGMSSQAYGDAFAIDGFRPEFSEVSVTDEIKCGNVTTAEGAAMSTSATSLRVISQALASGKSSSWFFCSEDGSLLVKTCSEKEKKTMLRILPSYLEYVEERGKTSLLPQFYGMYTVKFDGARPLSFIVMNYWFASSKNIQRRFDLKGSTFGRRASERELAKGQECIYKDNDFTERDATRTRHCDVILDALRHDCAFLEKHRLLDYSLVYGEYEAATEKEHFEAQKAHEEFETDHDDWGRRTLAEAVAVVDEDDVDRTMDAEDDAASETSDDVVVVEKKSMFTPFMNDISRLNQLRVVNRPSGAVFVGIIDILTPWGRKKQLERFFTSSVCCGRDVSCQRPKAYARRFYEFMRDRVFLSSDETSSA